MKCIKAESIKSKHEDVSAKAKSQQHDLFITACKQLNFIARLMMKWEKKEVK